MKFGVREICDVVLRAKTKMSVGSKTFYKDEPVLYFDTLTTSSLEGSATTVYAQGGRGNTRLMAWEGERSLTFNMTDALISPESFSVLSGAGIADISSTGMYVHTTTRQVVEEIKYGNTTVDNEYAVKVPGLVSWNHKESLKNSGSSSSKPTTADTLVDAGKDYYNAGADIFIMNLKNGEISSEPMIPNEAQYSPEKFPISYVLDSNDNQYYSFIRCAGMVQGGTVLVDYYVKQTAGKQIEITPDKFGSYFYLEASTLFRDEATGKDLPAEFVIPNCKIQSNFTFSMSSTGDPSTFDFVLDAFPDYTKFDQTKKVLAVIQIIDEVAADEGEAEPQRQHPDPSATVTVETAGFEHKSSYSFGAAATDTLNYAIASDHVATTGRLTTATVPI